MASEHQDPAGFGGQYGYYQDLQTGLEHLGARYYDGGTGRFVTRDPIGYGGGENLYAFCGNNPINESDPDGTNDSVQSVDPQGTGFFPSNWSEARARAKARGREALGVLAFIASNASTFASGISPDGMTPDSVLGQYSETGQLPYGFKNEAELKEFSTTLTDELREAGYGDTEAAFQGSAVTGEKYTTGEPFDVGRTSDYDIALANPRLLQKAKDLKIGLRSRGTRTGQLFPEEIEELGLSGLQDALSRQTGRKVQFMLFRSLPDVIKKAPSIPIWPGRQ